MSEASPALLVLRCCKFGNIPHFPIADQNSLVALQAGGYSHPWVSAYVLATLIVGLLLIVTFVVWEWKFAPYPMVPVSQPPRLTLALTLMIR